MHRFVLILFILPFLGCESSLDPDPGIAGLDLFPLEIGRYIEYDATSTIYVINSPPATRNFQIRQEIVDSFGNQAGTETFIIYRWERPDESSEWEFTETWSARREVNNIIVNEGNIPYLKLSLPPENELTWDGNALNGNVPDTYLMVGVDTPVTIGDLMNLASVNIIQEEFKDLFIGEENVRKEWYARDIGLIRREIRILEYCDFNDCPNQEVIESGIIYEETIRSYGVAE